MSANYRRGDYNSGGGGHNNPRGGGGGGRGRGGFNKPRRYWDNDDYHNDRDKGERRRRRYSRSSSRSKSRSRSYSRSRSRSPERRSDDLGPRGVTVVSQEQYPPASISALPKTETVAMNNWKPTFSSGEGYSEYGSQLQQANGSNLMSGREMGQMINPYMGQGGALNSSNSNPSLADYGGGGYGGYPMQQQHQFYQEQTATFPLKPIQPTPSAQAVVDTTNASSTSGKKKKEKRKKKKSRRRSSSSSSSSSDSSTSQKQRKSKGDSDDSSDSSSDSDDRKENRKAKEGKAEGSGGGGGGGGGLTEEQRELLVTQQVTYRQKLDLIEREIMKLQTKEVDLRGSRADARLMDENLKLQAELKGRCKAVHVVLEKIGNVLSTDKSMSAQSQGADKSVPVPVPPPPPIIGQRSKAKVIEGANEIKPEVMMDVDYIDNGQHWCRLCNMFPETLEMMLNHFHSQLHRDQVEQLGIEDKPWHTVNPQEEKAATTSARKIPLRGVQFFSPVEGWYCRLCNIWMGDSHCASLHMKNLEHNKNYMAFVKDHPDWETKWFADRERAYSRAHVDIRKTENQRKSRFDKPPSSEADENAGSIRVQMRNTVKVDQGPQFVSSVETKDAGIDEWMGKPQKSGQPAVAVLDTQKFADIIRQRHGAMKKEEESLKSKNTSVPAGQPHLPAAKSHEMKREEVGGREGDRKKFELQISTRENRDRERDTRDRDRDRDNRYRDSRGGGRRRSRSRSRERDRGYYGRRRSPRSRSRDRDRRNRDRDGGREKTEPVKKQMPIIGKMPLFKRPAPAVKEKSSEPMGDASSAIDDYARAYGMEAHTMGQYEETNYVYAEPYDTQMVPPIAEEGALTTADHSTYPVEHPPQSNEAFIPPAGGPAPAVTPRADDLKPPGEKEAPGGTNLDGDLQQALDIIYRGGGKGPPTGVPPPFGIPPPSHAAFDYASMSSYSNYMGYEPYQMPFDGYTPADLEEVNVAGNMPSANNSSKAESTDYSKPEPRHSAAAPSVKVTTETEGEDDIDDLRMLGIDVDDVAVVKK